MRRRLAWGEHALLIPSDSQNRFHNVKQEADSFVQSALNALSAHIAILDESGDIIGVNASWQTFAEDNGFRPSQYGIGLNYLAVCDTSSQRNSSEAPIVASGIRDIMAGKIDEFEMEYPCHSPLQRRWFVVRVSRFNWYGKTRYIVAHQNVTELKQVQIELGQSKKRLEAILDNINNSIVTIDMSGQITSANRATERIFGYDIETLKQMHIRQLIDAPFDDKTSFKKLNGEYGHELVGIHQNESQFPIYFALNELRLDDGSLYTCIIQDITYRKRMEAEIIERERVQVALEKERELRDLKNRFLSMMSHELRTPLTIIGLSYDSLKKYGEIYTPDEREYALDEIYNQSQHLGAMVEDVMTLSRAEMNAFNLELEDVDFITYCRDVVEEFQFAYHKTHRIEFECDLTKLRAQIDRKLMRRPLTNLLSNAIKYSPEGGKVVFYLGMENGQIVVRIQDSGIGIPEEDQARLFEPFHRASNVGTLPGTGLGLPITKQTVELHDGKLDFISNPQGTTFTISLPLT
jgi:PAS domain S-box-containing protein